MVAFLGYALWVTLKHLLKRRPAIIPKPSANGVDRTQPMSPMRAIVLLSTLQGADIVLRAGISNRPTTRSSHYRRSGDPFASHNRAHGRAKTLAPATRHQPARTPPV